MCEPGTSIVRKSNAFSRSSEDEPNNLAAIETCFFVVSLITAPTSVSINSIFPICNMVARKLKIMSFPFVVIPRLVRTLSTVLK